MTDDAPAIQAAVDAAQPGTTVFFDPGTYVVGKPIALASSVSLVGAGASATVLRFVGGDEVALFPQCVARRWINAIHNDIANFALGVATNDVDSFWLSH